MRAVLLIFAVVICSLTTLICPPVARAQTMQFTLQPPHQPIQMFGNAWTIFADGAIDQTSAMRLIEVIKKNSIPRNSMIYLNSPGGDLAGGMGLGRTIREYGLFTQVAKRGPMETTGDFRSYKVLPGGCFSACTLAYIGGVFRWMDSKSVYGVHRFYGDSANADNAQVASSIIIQYIRDMDVDPALFSEMTKAGRDEINAVPHPRLEALNVINNGQGKTRWTIEGTGDGLYLKGERDTSNGINKFILLCKQGKLSLYVVFDPVGRGEEILTHGAQSLMLDGEAIPLSHLREGEVTLRNGWVNAFYSLTPDLINKIKQAKTVGIAFQFVYGAPMFLGFDHMEVGDGRPKLTGFIASCR
jgi:hypothetical protein